MAVSTRDRVRAMRWAHRLVAPVMLRRLRVTVEDDGHVPAAGPVILASNHVSNLDNYVIQSATPRPSWFLGKSELGVGLFGRFNRAMGMVPIERGRGDRTAIDQLVALLADDQPVALFPEGTRSPTGELHKFRSGMARIAAQSGAPVVPVGIIGTDEVWPPGQRPQLRRPRRGVVTVRYGEPLAAPAVDARSRRAFTAEVRRAVARLSGQTCVERYAPLPAARDGDDTAR